MSYLDPPRFSFLGKFRANVPTRNNDLTNYDPAKEITVITPGDWNSFGTGNFEISDGSVKSAMGEDGVLKTQHADDPLIGAAVTSRPHGGDAIRREFGDAIIVDLDPSQRRLSTIFGLEVTVELNTANDKLLLNGTMKPTCFRDYWNQRALEGGGTATAPLMPASTAFQSVLSNVTWDGSYDMSPLLVQLYEISQENDGKLSIKFNVDRFLMSDDPDTRLTGRLIGTIGPYFENEPYHFVAHRRLVWTASPKTQQFFATPFRLDERRMKLVFDFGNSVQMDKPDGSPLNEEVFLAVLPIEGSTDISDPRVPKAPLKTTSEQLELTAGIVEADVRGLPLEVLRRHRIGVMLSPDDRQVVLAEHPSGKYIDVEEWAYRCNPGEQAKIQVRALRLGEPISETVPFYCITRAGLDINLPPDVVFPKSNPMSAETNKDDWGRGTLVVTAGKLHDLPDSRKYINSQIYMLGDAAGWQSWGMVGPPVTPAAEQGEIAPPNERLGIVTILVFNDGERIENPTWDDHIGPLFQRYAKLFPAMKDRIDLKIRDVVLNNAPALRASLQMDFDDPLYMPVTRDLSGYDRDLIIRWLDQQGM